MTAAHRPTRFTPDQDNKKALTPGTVRMKAAKSRMPGHNTRPDLASSFALPAKWDPSAFPPSYLMGKAMDPDEHPRRDIRTPGFNPRSRLPDTVAEPSPSLTGFPHSEGVWQVAGISSTPAGQRTGASYPPITGIGNGNLWGGVSSFQFRT